MEENRTNIPSEKPKSRKWLIIFFAALLLAGGVGCWYTRTNRLAENTIEETEPKPDEKKEETVANREPDHTLINGCWKSETTEDGRFLEFTIDYPEVTNFNGMKGSVIYDAKQNRYSITLKDETGESVFYIGEFEKNTGKVYYYETDDGEELFLTLNRDPDTAPENVIDNPTEQKPETTQNTVTNSGNSRPSSESGSSSQNSKPSGDSGNSSGKTGHYEEREVLVKEAYDEQVLVKKGECTSVLVTEAYDSQEMVYLDGAYYGSDMQEVLVCNQCGAVFYDDGIINHVANSDTCGSWHNDYVPINEPYWHNVEYKTVHHDAVYDTRCEPDEYTTVHHDAVYEIQMVWIED